ncbi:hypothetical protein JCM11251_003616 [Rhodosporidiobolus azoricus]
MNDSPRHSPDLGIGTSTTGGGRREEIDKPQSPRYSQERKKAVLDDDSDLQQDEDEEEDVKPLVRDGPWGAGSFRPKPKNLGVVDLCDESDGKTPPPPPPGKGVSRETLAAVRAVVPDVCPRHLLALAKQPRHMEGDPNAIANELFASNYPLRGGGYKYGDPDEGAASKGRGRSNIMEDEKEVEEEEEEMEREKVESRKRSAGKKEGEGKAKALERSVKGKKRVASSGDEDEDEEEVDQLASTDEAEEGEEDEVPLLSKDEAFRLKVAYLDAEGRKAGSEDYRKAALTQLSRDFNTFSMSHLKQIFMSDQCLELYAPTWAECCSLKRQGLLNRITTARDMDKPIRGADGKEHPRAEVPKSKMLAKEVHWLESYIHHKGKFDEPVAGKKYKPVPALPKQRKKVKKNGDEGLPPSKKKQAATRQELESGWHGVKPKKKKRRLDSGYGHSDDNDLPDCELDAMRETENEGGYRPMRPTYSGGFVNRAAREMSIVEPFSGFGRRLGD